jgi:hypothetical protein
VGRIFGPNSSGGLGLILGVYARLGGFALAVFMMMALFMAHSGLMGSQNHWFMVANNRPVTIGITISSRRRCFICSVRFRSRCWAPADTG